MSEPADPSGPAADDAAGVAAPPPSITPRRSSPRVRSLVSNLARLTVILGLLALAALAWQSITSTRDTARAGVDTSLLRAQERLHTLVRAAEMTAESAERAALSPDVSATTLRDALEHSLGAFEQRPELSHLGIALDAAGEYGYLQRAADGGIDLWLFPGVGPDAKVVSVYTLTPTGFALRQQLPADGYDPRARPFYRRALEVGPTGTWMPAYRWMPRDGGNAPLWGFSYVKQIRAADGRLLGVVDTDFDMPALNRFVDGLAVQYAATFHVVEPTAAGAQLVAGPGVQREPLPLPAALAGIGGHADRGFAGIVDLDGREHWTMARPVALGQGLDWLLVASRDQELVATPLRQQAWQLGVMLLIIAAGIVLALARRRAERQLREERDYADAVLDALPGVFHHYDDTLHLRRWNQSLERVTGYSPRELDGMLPHRFFPEDQHRLVDAGIEEVFTHGSFALDADYLLKDGQRVPYLFTGVQFQVDGRPGFVGLGTDVTELKQAQQRVLYLATHDGPTGLPNRNLLMQRLTRAIQDAGEANQHVALMLLDLDRFKVVNDGGGHPFGDAVLRAVGERLGGMVRAGDMVARQGGDKFLVMLTGLDSTDEAHTVAGRIADSLAAPLEVRGRQVHLTASIGVSVFPQDGTSFEHLLGNADVAMYRAKELGGNHCQPFTQAMSAATHERVALEAGLRTAAEAGQLQLVYQPKVDLRSGRIAGCEALLRWQHPELGNVSPCRFIPIAEDSGLIVPIGDWVLRTACRQARAWRDAGLAPLRIAVNLSARQFLQQDVVAWVTRTLADTGLAAEQLELELTESMIAQDVDTLVATIDQLKALGVTVSIDDFGTGYSSLSYLKRFRVDTLKIDRSFISDMLDEPKDAAIAVASIDLAHRLGFKVIAEGVETAAQAVFLREHGCDEIQGYHFSRPVPAAELEAMLRADQRLE